jgi:hypothetical protein
MNDAPRGDETDQRNDATGKTRGRPVSKRAERALERGIEDSMDCSDPPSIVQPGKTFTDSK